MPEGPARILVMDDEDLLRDLARGMFAALGHEVEVASHGEEAIARNQEAMEAGRLFQLVILDLTIKGGLGGEETLRRLRRLGPELKAVVSSGSSDDPVLSQDQAHGFDGLLGKPSSIEELKDCLAALLP